MRFILSESRLEDALEVVNKFCRTSSLEQSVCAKAKLVYEELVTNVFVHAVKLKATYLDVRVREWDDSVFIEMCYDGGKFDPTVFKARADLETPVENRKEGGLGLLLVFSFSKSLEYKREGEENRVYVEIR